MADEATETLDNRLRRVREQALAKLDGSEDQVPQAFAAAAEGLREHPDTAGHPAVLALAQLVALGRLTPWEAARSFIEDKVR